MHCSLECPALQKLSWSQAWRARLVYRLVASNSRQICCRRISQVPTCSMKWMLEAAASNAKWRSCAGPFSRIWSWRTRLIARRPRLRQRCCRRCKSVKLRWAAIPITCQTHSKFLRCVIPSNKKGLIHFPRHSSTDFLLEVHVEYPSALEEVEIARRTTSGENPEIRCVVSAQGVLDFGHLVPRIPITDEAGKSCGSHHQGNPSARSRCPAGSGSLRAVRERDPGKPVAGTGCQSQSRRTRPTCGGRGGYRAVSFYPRCGTA